MAVNELPYDLVQLKGGAFSVRSRAYGETMHIGSDPRKEAWELYVHQQRLIERAAAASGPFVIWDVGLGPAGNAISALEALIAARRRGVAEGLLQASPAVEIHSFDITTTVLEFALAHSAELGYLAGWEQVLQGLLRDGVVEPAPGIRWHLHVGDFRDCLHVPPPPSAIFHDPYSPARNPEMWSLEVFQAMRQRVAAAGANAEPCLLTNYTRSTAVRVTLALAGWYVGLGVPTGEKDQTTIASTHLEALERPLDGAWLNRVRSSTNGAVIRGGIYARGPILDEDLQILEALPQFCR